MYVYLVHFSAYVLPLTEGAVEGQGGEITFKIIKYFLGDGDSVKINSRQCGGDPILLDFSFCVPFCSNYVLGKKRFTCMFSLISHNEKLSVPVSIFCLFLFCIRKCLLQYHTPKGSSASTHYGKNWSREHSPSLQLQQETRHQLNALVT